MRSGFETLDFSLCRALRWEGAGSARPWRLGAGSWISQPLSKERGRICRKACEYRAVTHLLQEPSSSRHLVLDTNIVLDWLWFGDPRVAPLSVGLEDGSLTWWATLAMRDELASVLPRLVPRNEYQSRERVLTSFDRCARLIPPAPTHRLLRCSDPDDQKFIDLALATGAHGLLSRDRAVLRLARRAAASGCVITVPERWWPRSPTHSGSSIG